MNESRLEVLLVEDSLDDAGLTIRALKRKNSGIRLLHLRDGQEALDHLLSDDLAVLPRLILLDLKMPRVGGIDLLRQIKSNPRLRVIPVVMLTSSKEDEDMVESYSLGVNAYIVKPVSYENFTEAVSDLGEFWIRHNEFPHVFKDHTPGQ